MTIEGTIISTIIGSADGPTTIFLAGVIGEFFMIPAYIVIMVFYGIYFAKQFLQRKQGIQTRQLGRRKEKKIRIIEILLSISTVLIVPIQLISITYNWSILPTAARIVGIFIGLLGDLIFLIAIVTMKNSWRAGIPDQDKTELITHGIYQYSRNPAFLGFYLMYISILLMYCNILLLIVTTCTILMLHLQIIQEEAYLVTAFGNKYIEYRKSTRRYLGKKR